MSSSRDVSAKIRVWWVDDGYSKDQIVDLAIEYNDSLNGKALSDESLKTHIDYIVEHPPNYWKKEESDAKAISEAKKPSTDTGYTPDRLLTIPGFVDKVINHTLDTQIYPNRAMAFCGATTLQSTLISRRVTDRFGTTPNVYLMGLGNSGSGKNRSREVNKEIMLAIGMDGHLGEQFASAEGMEDAMMQHKVMLYQNDEFDTFLTNTNKGKDIRYTNLQSMFMRFYTEAKSFYTMRRLAKERDTQVIFRPHLIIFGTAVPRFFFESLTEQQLDNGFFSRNWIVYGSFERKSNKGVIVHPVPQEIINVAAWWKEYNNKDFFNLDPTPTVIEHDADALRMLEEIQDEFDAKYLEAERNGDGLGVSMWARGFEGVNKHCLIGSTSRDYTNLYINTGDVELAYDFIMWQLTNSSSMIDNHVYVNDIQKDIRKAEKIIKSFKGVVNKGVLQNRMGSPRSREFNELLDTMRETNMIDIESIKAEGRGRPAVYVRYIKDEYGNLH